MSFVQAVVPPPSYERAVFFVLRRGDLLVTKADTRAPRLRALSELGLHAERTQFLGMLDGVPCFGADVADDAEAPEGYAFLGIRPLYLSAPPDEVAVAGTAAQVMHWDRGHQFCARCGGPVEQKATERAKRCERCKVDYFPRIQPAAIVLVHDGPRILLARAPNFPAPWYALVAGFLEPGETLEECAAREVREETGVSVTDVRYFGSQPWPFPHQVMIGFTARWAGGDIVIDRSELEDARWFHVDAMPQLPPPISIARRMIDAFVAEQRGAR